MAEEDDFNVDDLIDNLFKKDAEEAVILTDRAVKQVLKIKNDESIPDDQFLRVGVKGGGCSGMSYILGFDYKNDFDETLDREGIKVIVDKRHLIYLGGTVIDFKDGLDARGFTFQNPRASTTCGCGSSFST
ncbi:MAG TPA: iron-sulfur cluster assembly accessory protein [Bacteroidetes bacterium]|nr:iron-sulfur cluster assembly accessory protein [Bacteroidota bacterium]